MPKIKPLFKSKAEVSPNCEKCGLYKTCNTPRMKYTGAGKKKILIVAEAPGKTEDERGEQLIGQAGQELRRRLKMLGYNLDRDFWKVNAINCRPPKNRKPKRKELIHCFPYLKGIIGELKPKLIILLGGVAVEAFYAGAKYGFKDLTISTWRGLKVPDRDYNAWICPTFHPSFLIRNERDANLKAVFSDDLEKALQQIDKPFPELKSQTKSVKILTDANEIIKELKEIQKNDVTSLDWETNMLKPHDGGKILTASISCDEYAIAYPIHYPKAFNKKDLKRVEKATKEYLRNKKCKTVCHNKIFEDMFAGSVLKARIAGAIACTMNDSHILDNKGMKYTSLKFQSFIRWGVYGYEKKMKRYMPETKGGYEKNNLDKMPLHELLLYNGTDTFLTQRLYREQCEQFAQNKQLSKCRKLFLRSSKVFTDIQLTGIHIDSEGLQKRKEEIEEEIESIISQLKTSEEAKKFKESTGKELDINSSKDLRTLFYKVLHFEGEKTTNTGMKSVDAETLHTWQGRGPFIDNLLLYKKLDKILRTYIGQIQRETRNNLMFPNFHLNSARTGRSSSTKPNFQNLPTREQIAKEAVRKYIIPSKGNKILEVDFGSLEVRIIACYTKCPVLVDYILDETTDMHRDQAISLFKLDSYDKKKGDDGKIRFFAKNNWVFPQFYGSWYKSCSVGLIDNCFNLTTSFGVKIRKHLKSKGIRTTNDFVEHLRNEEEVFWKRFAAVKEWQNKQINNFKNVLHTDSFFGFQAKGHLSNNDLINYPIQGAAFHCLLWCLNELNRKRIKRKWKSKIIGQIHDSIVFDLVPEEEEEILGAIKNVMEVELKEAHKWMIVPMAAEVEVTGIDQPWMYKEEVKL